jgi:O-antigen/teichoic acid export membrane protein
VTEANSTIPTIQSEATTQETKQKLQLKRYARPLMVYGFTIFSNAALSFATFALLTHYLTEVDYGIINLYNSFIMLLMPFIGIGVPFVLNVDFFKMEKEAFSKQFTNALVIPITACILFTLLSLLFHSYIERLTKVNYLFIAVAAFSCLLVLLNDVVLNLLRNKERYYLFAGFSLGKNLVEVSLTILLVVGMGLTWTGRLGSNLITLVLSGIIILFLVRKWQLITGHVDKKIIGAILLAGLPFIPERLALFTMGYSDRFFIDHFSGTADVGYYGAGAQLAMVVNLSILTLNNTFYPKLFKSLSKSLIDQKEIRRVIWMYLGISAFITLTVIAFVPLFFRFFIGPNFQPGKIYAIYLSIGFFFWSVYNIFVAFLLNLRKNKLIMKISIAGMLISLGTNYFSVQQFGALGATYTSMLVYFSMAVITIFFVQRYYRLKSTRKP